MEAQQTKRYFIHAINVHTGGGKGLLLGILKYLHKAKGDQYTLLVDSRLPLKSDDLKIKIIKVPPTISDRFKAEVFLKKNVRCGDQVLCFGNLPPLFKLKGKVILFLQNRLLIEKKISADFPLKLKIKILIEKFWLHFMNPHVDQTIVQTQSMKNILLSLFGKDIQVEVFPFIDSVQIESNNVNSSDKQYDLIYVSSGEPYKNHKKLLLALVLLSQEGHFPHLCLTVNSKIYPSLFQWIMQLSQMWQLKITNWDASQNRFEVVHLYQQSKALIFPSTIESLGMPLIEAQQLGLPILASELDFVRDILDPEQTFNPHSEYSIAKAIQRFLNLNKSPNKIRSPGEFLTKIFGEEYEEYIGY